jgi:hypothetical protein
VHIVTRLRAGQIGNTGLTATKENRFFSIPKPSYGLLWPTQTPLQWVTEAFRRGVKRLERETDHSSESSVEVNHE